MVKAKFTMDDIDYAALLPVEDIHSDVYLLRSVKKGGNICDEVVSIDPKSSEEIKPTIALIVKELGKLKDKELMLAALAETVDKFLNSYRD